ncbi:MAG: pilus assembly protein N-terminal domain-containing protein [Roseiarcus sp.]|jgi:hypothetical protein
MLRHTIMTFALISGLVAAAPGTGANAAAADDILQVTVDQAKVTQLPDGTVTLVIGNPIVADVTMLKGSGTMVLTGKGFGETNMIALDKDGNVIDEKTIRVVPTGAVLLVQRGMERESYACSPKCMPTVQLGDGKQFGDVSSQINSRNSLVAPTQGGQAPH